ncbi:restriction endonuclease subunit S [Variovorax paradoxus]|uniref:restriction endonuclease subunit S n=1 Tax=Variovorax paradoxus TaxID=34073 RepID=UPI0029C98F99|nr:restriction endonuclease subunit S [Variovorax paradoxus]WPH19844.1 restriction endonuclease subunit S [Variovorax paradoxus]
MLLPNLDLLATAPGGVARLRELILTLAVQGKLVPQDPADEPASVLLQKIRAEKDRLIAKGKSKRDKPLAKIAEGEQPFELPQGWEWVRLGEITNYGTTTKVERLQPDTWVLDMEDIEKSSGRLLQRLRFAERPALSDKNCFFAGDVLYGKLRPYLNKVLVADEDGVCTTEIIPFHCYGDYVPQYFRLVLSSPFFLEYVNARSYGMKMPRLGTEDARKSLIPLSPLAEQSRIVTRVEELMRLCDALETKGQLEAAQHAQLVSTLLGTLTASTTPEDLADHWQRVAQHFDLLLDRPEAIDALEQTLVQLAVRGLLVPQDPADEPASTLLARIRAEKDRLIVEGRIKRDKPLPPIAKDEQPFGLPTGWEWARLDSIFQVITDGDHLPPPVSEAGIAFLTIGNISSGVLNFDGCRLVPQDYFDDIAEYRRPAKGDILYTVVGASYGRAVVVETDRSFCVQRHIGILKPSVQVNLQYLATLLGSQLIYEQATRSLTGTAQPTVGIRPLRNFLAPLPPLAEQSRIVTRITALRRLCADLRQRLKAAQVIQSHLAQALVESSNCL